MGQRCQIFSFDFYSACSEPELSPGFLMILIFPKKSMCYLACKNNSFCIQAVGLGLTSKLSNMGLVEAVVSTRWKRPPDSYRTESARGRPRQPRAAQHRAAPAIGSSEETASRAARPRLQSE